MISRPCVTKRNQMYQKKRRIVLFLLIRWAAFMCPNNVFVINEFKLFKSTSFIIITSSVALFSGNLGFSSSAHFFFAKTASLDRENCLASICWANTGICDNHLLTNGMHIVLKRRTSCILYDFVVLQYRVTEVHFIVMYEFLYHISGMRNFCSVERTQLLPIKMVHRVEIIEIV